MKKILIILAVVMFSLTTFGQKFRKDSLIVDWATLSGSDTSKIWVTTYSGHLDIIIDEETYTGSGAVFNIQSGFTTSGNFANWTHSELPYTITNGTMKEFYADYWPAKRLKIVLTKNSVSVGVTRVYITFKYD